MASRANWFSTLLLSEVNYLFTSTQTICFHIFHHRHFRWQQNSQQTTGIQRNHTAERSVLAVSLEKLLLIFWDCLNFKWPFFFSLHFLERYLERSNLGLDQFNLLNINRSLYDKTWCVHPGSTVHLTDLMFHSSFKKLGPKYTFVIVRVLHFCWGPMQHYQHSLPPLPLCATIKRSLSLKTTATVSIYLSVPKLNPCVNSTTDYQEVLEYQIMSF